MVPFSLGHGIYDMEPNGPSVCSFGPLDVLPTESRSESFMALRLESTTQHHLEIMKFNIDDYSVTRKKAGYICEKEGMNLNCSLASLMGYFLFASRTMGVSNRIQHESRSLLQAF